MEVVKSQSKF